MQKGFAAAEVIFVVLIISILMAVAVPNAVRLVDIAALDYEQKRLYGELQFARTLNRTATVTAEGLNMSDFLRTKITVSDRATFEIDTGTNSYRIMRGKKLVHEEHHLSSGVTFSDETDVPAKIFFDTAGYSDVTSKTIVLISRLGNKSTIVFDSVGRIRGGK